MAPPPAECSISAQGTHSLLKCILGARVKLTHSHAVPCRSCCPAPPSYQQRKKNASTQGWHSDSATPNTTMPFPCHPDLAASPGAGAGIPHRLPAGSSSPLHHAPIGKPEQKHYAEIENGAFRRRSGVMGLQR